MRAIPLGSEIVSVARENRGVIAALCEPKQAMSDCLDSVRETVCGLDDKAIIQMLRDVEVLSRKAQSVMLELVAEIDSRGIAGREGFGLIQRMLAGRLKLSAAEARMRVEHAAMVGTRQAMTGETLPARLPATAAALASGEVGTGQLRVITETMVLMPATVPEPARAAEEFPTTASEPNEGYRVGPGRLRPGGRRWVSTQRARTPGWSPEWRSCPWPVVWERG